MLAKLTVYLQKLKGQKYFSLSWVAWTVLKILLNKILCWYSLSITTTKNKIAKTVMFVKHDYIQKIQKSIGQN